MILELINFQQLSTHQKCDAKLQKNIQTTKYQFFTQKKHTSVITTLYAQTKSIIYCLT